MTHIGQDTKPIGVLEAKLALPARSDPVVAIATVHWFVAAGFKGYLSILAALGTCCREHLPLGSVARATAAITLCFSCLAAGGAALGLISIALRMEELLVFSAEGERSTTIGALD